MTLINWPYVRRVLSPSEVPTRNPLLMAIFRIESSFDPYAVQYEPDFQYVWNVEAHARMLGITQKTERIMQQTSWGLGQIMGGTARWLGYNGPLTDLLHIETNVLFSETYLNRLLQRYNNNIEKAIASYRRGNARHCTDDVCSIDEYVQKVMAEYNMEVKNSSWERS